MLTNRYLFSEAMEQIREWRDEACERIIRLFHGRDTISAAPGA